MHHSLRIFGNLAGALGNGLKWVEWAKVGLIAYPMQNYIRNMIGTLFLMCGGLILSKLRILDSTWKGNFNLVGIRVWQEIHFTDVVMCQNIYYSMDFLLA